MPIPWQPAAKLQQSGGSPAKLAIIADEMMRVTLAIVGQTLFSKDVERDASI